MAKMVAMMGDKSWRTDARASEKTLYFQPFPILQSGEKIELAYRGRGGFGWDRIFFTNMRIMTRDCNGIGGMKKEFLSIPYSAIQGYVVDTPAMIDTDVTVKIFSPGLSETTFDFAPAGCDSLEVMRHLNRYVLPGGMDVGNEVALTDTGDAVEESKGGLLDLICGDARQIPPEEIEPKLKADPKNILLPNEKVELAFKSGRDTTIFTTHRYLIMDVQGITGKKVVYTSVLWNTTRAFEVQTAGTLLDRDCEISVFTSIHKLNVLKTELNKDKCDLMAIQRYVSDKVLGIDTDPPSAVADEAEGAADSGAGLFGWLCDDNRQIDASLVNGNLHKGKTNVLQGSEKVELAFKGRRDLMVFTNKRLMIVDYKGLISKKTKYFSLPWASIKMFAVRSAGSFMDKDSELMLWLDIMHDWLEIYDEDGKLVRTDPMPGMSYLEMDFQKDKVDLMGVHRYLSQRILAKSGVEATSEGNEPDVSVGDSSGLEQLLGWLGDDANQISHEVMTQRLHSNNMIMEDETVLMAMKCGLDITCFTNKRIFFLDHQRSGIISTKMEYKSLPYGSLKAFEIQTAAGFLDFDAEAKYFTMAYWQDTIEQDLRKGKVDIFALQAILSSAVLGGQNTESGLEMPVVDTPDEGALSGFMNILNGDGAAFDAAEAEKLFRDSSPKILMSDETVDMAFKCGRDFILYTNLRMLTIDKQGIFGKKISYNSTPFKSLTSFVIQTAGSCIDNDSEAWLYADIPARCCVKATMKADKTGGIFDVMTLFSGKKLREANEAEMKDWQERTDVWKAENAAKIAAIEKAKADKAAAKALKKSAKQPTQVAPAPA